MASTVTVSCACCERCENQGPYYTNKPTCAYGSTRSTITTASGGSLLCWSCNEAPETCEDLGSYYTNRPTCMTGMTASQTTVTSASTNTTYTCWQCMFTDIPATCADFGLYTFDTSIPAYQPGGECYRTGEWRYTGDVADNGKVAQTNLRCSSCVPSGDPPETCEDLGSYYTNRPTCMTGMTASQTTVTSASTNTTYTCWECKLASPVYATCASWMPGFVDETTANGPGKCNSTYSWASAAGGVYLPDGTVTPPGGLKCTNCVPSGNTYATCECFPGLYTNKADAQCYPAYYQPYSFGLAEGSSGGNCPNKTVKPGGITCWECPTDCSTAYGFASVGVGGQSVYIG